MDKHWKYLLQAAKIAYRSDRRKFHIGAIGIRKDGTIVSSRNIQVRHKMPEAHAENRLCQKLDVEAIIYVARIQSDGTLSLAKPCQKCQNTMRFSKVKRCYYTISDHEYGVIIL